MAVEPKTKVVLMREFIRDLQEGKYPNMATHAFSHVFNDKGVFKFDRNDHQYDGISDGYIRWVSMSGVGLRLIYIRKGDTVYLYRIVGKGKENGIPAPKSLESEAEVGDIPEELLAQLGEAGTAISKRILTNSRPTYLRDAVRRMYHVPQIEITLVSPRLSFPLFRISGEIGRFLDRAIEDGAVVRVITRPAPEGDFEFFDDLARRNIIVHFVQNLQSRLYLFRVAEFRAKTREGEEKIGPTALMGSAELTHHGLGIGDVGKNEELCYHFSERHFLPFHSYADELLKGGTDLQGHKMKLKGYSA